MPVTGFSFVVVLSPLHYLTVLAYLRFREFFTHTFQLFSVIGIYAQHFASFYHCCEQFVYYLAVHRGSHADRTFRAACRDIGVLRRYGGAGHKLTLAVVDKEIHKEQRCFFQRIVLFCKELSVTAVKPVFPYVSAKPCRACHPLCTGHPQVLRRSIAPDVCIVVADKAAAAIHLPCCFTSVGAHSLYMIEQGHMQVAQIGDFCQPVVHLGIYIHGKSAAPCRPHILVPDALQIQRERTLAASGDHKVSAKVKIQADQAVVNAALFHRLQSLIGGQAVIFALIKDYLRPVKITAVVLDMFFQQFFKIFLCRCDNVQFGRLLIIADAAACLRTYEYGHAVAALSDDAAAPSVYAAARTDDTQVSREIYAVLAAAAAAVEYIGIIHGAVVIKIIVPAVKGKFQRDACRLVCRDVYCHHLCRFGTYHPPCIIYAFYGIFRSADSVFKVKAPALVFAFALKVVLYHKVAQRHIVPLIYGRTAESLQHYLFGFGYLLFFKQLSYLFKVLPR